MQNRFAPTVQIRVKKLGEIILKTGTLNVFRRLQTRIFRFQKSSIAQFLGVDFYRAETNIANVDGRKGWLN